MCDHENTLHDDSLGRIIAHQDGNDGERVLHGEESTVRIQTEGSMVAKCLLCAFKKRDPS
jgi:hypothetical protein